MNRFREMQAFDAAARSGSLAAAARQLGRSPGAILRAIASLEARLRGALLVRGPRGVSLTPEGDRFAQSCRQILEQTEVAERSAAGLHARPEGQLTVALPQFIDTHVFAPIALGYLERFPDVRLLIRACEEVPKLLKDGIDAALVIGDLPSSSEFAIPLGMVRPMVCAAPGYLARWGCPEVPGDLKAHRSVACPSPGHDAQWRFARGHSTWAVTPAPVLTCTTQSAAIHAATLGAGLVRCMSYQAHEALRCGQLEPVLAAFTGAHVPVHLMYRHGRRAEARVRTFIDYAVPLLRAHPAFAG